MKRILFLTQWFYPELSFKGLPFAKELGKLGYEVQVLTGFPNYPGGKVYDGYKIKLFQREVIDGISVFRVPLYPSHDNSVIGRIINYTSFALSALFLGLLGIKRPDVIYVYHPPATIGLPALFFHLLYRAPFVYDIQDLWPDTLAATGMVNNKLIIWLVKKWCQFIYSQAAKIIVLSPGFKETLKKRGVPENKIEVIYNWCHEEHLQSVMRNEDLSKELGMEDRFNVVFAGTMGKAQALGAVLDAAYLLSCKLPNIQFVFVGSGVEVERLKKRKNKLGLQNVRFLPHRPMSEIGEILGLADVLLVHLKDDPLFKITIPGKTQAYMAAGRPILIGVKGDAAELVKRAEAGVPCEPENPNDIALAVEKLYFLPKEKLEQMGRNGRDFYLQKLSLSVGAHKFEKVFASVI
jgi:colanic acid biosynthesis glycosyl transferase WcaI